MLHATVGRPCFSFTRLAPFGPSWQDFQRPPLNCSWLDGGLPRRIWSLLYAGCYFPTMRTQPMSFLTPQGFSLCLFQLPGLSEGTGAAVGTGLSETHAERKAECSPQISGSGKYYYHYFCYSYIMSKIHHRTMSSLCSLPVEKDKSRYSIPSGQGPNRISRRSHPYPRIHHSTDFVLPYAASISLWYIFTIILRFNFCAGVSNPYISSASFSLLQTSKPHSPKI
jgi:hypothetical protein